MDFLILDTRPTRNRAFMVDAVTVYGRRVGTVVAWWQTTTEGIQAALERSHQLQILADTDRAGALSSVAADFLDPPEP